MAGPGVGLLISRLVCRLSITQTEKRSSAIDGGNGKAPSLFETIGGVTPTLRLVSSFQPGLAGAPQGPGFLYLSPQFAQLGAADHRMGAQ